MSWPATEDQLLTLGRQAVADGEGALTGFSASST